MRARWISILAGMLVVYAVFGFVGAALRGIAMLREGALMRPLAALYPGTNAVLALLAGSAALGLLRRRRWGRIVFAVWAVLLGLQFAVMLFFVGAMAGLGGLQWFFAAMLVVLTFGVLYAIVRLVWRVTSQDPPA